MAQNGLFHPLSSVCFEAKIQFSARRRLCLARSRHFKLVSPAESRGDARSINPPDFSLKLYRSLSVPHRKERKTSADPGCTQQTAQRKRRATTFLPRVLHESHQRKDPPRFIALYRPPDALEAERWFVKAGKYPTGPYQNPRPHNFRPLDEELPDMITTYDKDPGDLNFKLKNLDTLQTTRFETDCSSTDSRAIMDMCKSTDPKWDVRLILPRSPWPPKSASYTRHRRRRGAYSAFLDRVEEKLSRSWKNRS